MRRFIFCPDNRTIKRRISALESRSSVGSLIRINSHTTPVVFTVLVVISVWLIMRLISISSRLRRLLWVILIACPVRMPQLLWGADGVFHCLFVHPPLFLLNMQHNYDRLLPDESTIQFNYSSLRLFCRFVRPTCVRRCNIRQKERLKFIRIQMLRKFGIRPEIFENLKIQNHDRITATKRLT